MRALIGNADRRVAKSLYELLQSSLRTAASQFVPGSQRKWDHTANWQSQNSERGVEQFDAVFNRPSHINEEAANRLPQVDIDPSLNNPPILLETEIATSQLSSGKPPGVGAIPTEVYKDGSATAWQVT